MSWTRVGIYIGGSLGVFLTFFTAGGVLSYIFRKLFADFGQRWGPNRAGPGGIFQFLAVGIKLIFKEDIIPTRVEEWGFRIAPYIAFVPPVIALSPIPFGRGLLLTDVRVGLILIFALAALAPLGEIVAGWASNNKYAMLGGLRAAAMDVAYEIPLLISAVAVIMFAGSANTREIVGAQRHLWYVVYQPLGLFIFLVTMIGKIGVIPFDLPEAESELVAGYVTEYSGMRFGFFFVALFANVFFISALAVTLYFGGWQGPWLPGIVWFIIKSTALMFLIFWIWNSLPRLRIDQFLDINWKVLFPLSLINLLATAIGLGVIG
ncbi:MAG: NADH-quinone oxidoreductase subunit NuoH [Candidatus Bipolaricaulia bacterium]